MGLWVRAVVVFEITGGSNCQKLPKIPKTLRIWTKNVKKLPNIVKRKKNLFIKWNNWCKKNNLSKLKAAILFIKTNKKIDKMVIGLDKVENLKQIVGIVNNDVHKENNFYPQHLLQTT